MNNSYLSSRSENFDDDSFERIEKRCFFLICGRNPHECAISISIGMNAFEDMQLMLKPYRPEDERWFVKALMKMAVGYGWGQQVVLATTLVAANFLP